MTSIPVHLRNKIKSEVISCIQHEDEDPRTCIIRAAKMNGLTREQAEEIPILMDVE